MNNPDREISFFPSNKLQALPTRAVLGAMGFLGLRRSLPSAGREASPLFRGMTGLCFGPDWALAEPVLGGPMAVMALEELSRRGVRECIFLGLAGSLNPDLKPGDLWCPRSGVSTEGISAHYPAPLEPDAELHQRVFNQADQMGLKLRDGLHWSTDGFYRETAGLVERHRQAGALGVDMECTGLWAAARFRGIRLVALMVISDLLYDGQHHLGFDLPEFTEGLKQATQLAWRALGVNGGALDGDQA